MGKETGSVAGTGEQASCQPVLCPVTSHQRPVVPQQRSKNSRPSVTWLTVFIFKAGVASVVDAVVISGLQSSLVAHLL